MRTGVIITDDLIQALKKHPEGLMHLHGIPRISENLIQVQSLQPRDDLKRVAQFSSGVIELEDLHYSIPISEIEVIPLLNEFTSRSQGIIDTNALAQKKAAFIGLGSVGSQVSLHLAQSALGHFVLLDPDTLSAANLSRHACDLNDLGRYKTKAVRDLILRRNPKAKVEAFEEDFLQLDGEEQVALLGGSDLVIASTDSNAAQFLVNEICHELSIPSLFAGCYERACAGEILFVIPGKTPCFNCFMEFRQSHF